MPLHENLMRNMSCILIHSFISKSNNALVNSTQRRETQWINKITWFSYLSVFMHISTISHRKWIYEACPPHSHIDNRYDNRCQAFFVCVRVCLCLCVCEYGQICIQFAVSTFSRTDFTITVIINRLPFARLCLSKCIIRYNQHILCTQ